MSWKHKLYSFAQASGLSALVRRRLAGLGSILLFHEILPDPSSELMAGVSTDFLDAALAWLRENGWEFVSLDDLITRITSGDSGRRFIALTFDDGYRDNVSNALPILERYGAPFTLYVPTGILSRNLYCWWIALRKIFQTRDSVYIEAVNRRFHCSDLPSKIAALNVVTRWVQQDYRRKAMLRPTFTASNISMSELNQQYFLSTNDLQVLARHPLTTIGSHTRTHPALSTLDVASARREMAESRSYLENLLQKPIAHFAYPYGDTRACSQREGALAAEAGFKTAVTSRRGQLWAEHVHHPHALPRIGINAYLTVPVLDARISGLSRALKLRSSVVTW